MLSRQSPAVNRPWVRDVISIAPCVAGLTILIAMMAGALTQWPHAPWAATAMMGWSMLLCGRRVGDSFWTGFKASSDGSIEAGHVQQVSPRIAGRIDDVRKR